MEIKLPITTYIQSTIKIFYNVISFGNGILYTHKDNLNLKTNMHVVQSARIDMQPDNRATQKCCNAYANAMNFTHSKTMKKM
jgi:hypothetical protein